MSNLSSGAVTDGRVENDALPSPDASHAAVVGRDFAVQRDPRRFDESNEHVLGMVWADAQSQAEALASNFFGEGGPAIHVRPAEDREIPMRVSEPSCTSPFLS